LRLLMPPQGLLERASCGDSEFSDFASSAFRSNSSSSKQSRYYYVGSIFGKYNYFITLYINIVILIAYHVTQRMDVIIVVSDGE
jgi:hypothetical protein